jgi:hypothetical protein
MLISRPKNVFIQELAMLSPAIAGKNAQTRTDTSNSKRKQGFFHPPSPRVETGELSMSACWHAIGWPNVLRSSPILKRPEGKNFLEMANESLALLGSALWLLHPRLARRGGEVLDRITDGTLEEACVAELHAAGTGPLWPTPFTAISIVSNKETHLHRDGKGIAPFFDLLTTLGQYRNGQLRVPGLGLTFEYDSGTMVALCGKALAHAVPKVEGERICIVQYFHAGPLDTHSNNLNLQDQHYNGWMDIATFEAVEARGSLYDLGTGYHMGRTEHLPESQTDQ